MPCATRLLSANLRMSVQSRGVANVAEAGAVRGQGKLTPHEFGRSGAGCWCLSPHLRSGHVP